MTVTVNIQTTSGFNHFWSSFYNELANSPITADGATTDFVATDTGAFDGQSSGMKFAFSGTGLVYGGSFPNIHLTAGTITAIEVRDASDQVLATFTGFNIPATTFESAMATYVTGHGPSPGGDGHPDASGLDALFKTVPYNVTGNSGPDYFEGGNLADTINGSGGADYLDGAGGADNMTGGLGNDIYIVENAGDVVNESAGQGNDAVDTYVDYVLPANIEYLNLLGNAPISGTGNDLANIIYGNSAANIISGGAGFDYLDGGSGADTMIGGLDNDNYVVENSGDVIIENPDEGFESVILTATWMMSANVDSVNMQNSGGAINCTGNNIDNQIFGNSSVNVLSGGGGNDILSGEGGADTMSGGTGDDLCFVDNAGDVVIENANEGTDQIYSTVSYTISANVENMNLTVANLTGTGNNLDNIILGYQGGYMLMGLGGNDTLNGQAGADTMYGGTGNDTYYVETAGDAVIENAGEGTDTVHTSINYTLGADVENLEMDYLGDLAGFGNSLDNVITGNDHNNVIGGGLGADTMIGGFGNDAYFVDNAGDVVIENAGQGSDTVYSTTHLTLGANVEHLVLQGSADLQGYGNALSNAIYGNSGSNILNGGGNADMMVGGDGNDAYFVDNPGDLVIENANEGMDTVYSTAHLRLGANVEHLVLQGNADLQGYGNAQSNAIYGNSGSNLIDGGGGADMMVGGAGNDAYFVDDPGDFVMESANEGDDTVYSTANLALGANIENLILQGTADLQGYGNAQSNAIYGNSGNNLIDGRGGADTMTGGAGNDAYFVENAADAVFEMSTRAMTRSFRPRTSACREMSRTLFYRATRACRATATPRATRSMAIPAAT